MVVIARSRLPKARQRRPSLVGYLNLIHPNKIQIIGADELAFLDGLSVTAGAPTCSA